MAPGGFPKAGPDDVAWFDELLPPRPEVERKPMFGNLAGFAGGQMFLALFGEQVAVRLDEAGRDGLLAEEGAEPFEPMQGRPMREYVVLPLSWRDTPERAKPWVERGLAYALSLPPKPKKAKKRATG